MPHLSIIIPAYNESERLPDTLALVRDWVEKQSFETEVLVVDDGSKDTTVDVVEEIIHRFPGLKLLKNEQNKGKGGVVKQGMLAAKGDWRLFMDADHSTPITEADKLLSQTKEFEVVIGSRYLHPESIKIKQPWKRRVISRLGNQLIQMLVLPGVVDTQCGFKLFSAAATEAIFPKQVMNGWAFDIEILTIAKELGYALKEVPVDWYDAHDSKLRALSSVRQSYRDLWIIYRRVKAKSYRS